MEKVKCAERACKRVARVHCLVQVVRWKTNINMSREMVTEEEEKDFCLPCARLVGQGLIKHLAWLDGTGEKIAKQQAREERQTLRQLKASLRKEIPPVKYARDWCVKTHSITCHAAQSEMVSVNLGAEEEPRMFMQEVASGMTVRRIYHAKYCPWPSIYLAMSEEVQEAYGVKEINVVVSIPLKEYWSLALCGKGL